MKSRAVDCVRSAAPRRLAAMMDVEVDTRGLWDAGELGQILCSHLSAPITPAEHEDAYGRADGPCLGELLCDPEVPEEQLQRLCRLAAAARQDPDALMPPEVATLLYYAGAAAGIVRRGRRLEHLDDTALLEGLTWCAAQPWVDERTRSLLKEAAAALAGPLTIAPDLKDPANLPAVGPASAHVEALSGLSERAETFVAAPPPVPGYRLVKELSRGGQGVVYQGVRESTGRTVAVKILRDGPLAGRRDRERFLREVHILAGLRHPNVATVFDSGTTNDGWSYLVTDFIPGVPLDQYLAWGGAGTTDTGTVPAPAGTAQRLQLFLKIARAVQAAHQAGVVHRDLKPSNILVDQAGEPHVVDFGVARVVDVSQPSPVAPSAASRDVATLTGQFVGSLPWSSPEQAEGRQGEVDARADVYSLGVILYQLLSGGRFPYDVTGPTWRALRNISSAAPAPLRHTRPNPEGSTRVPWPVERVVQKALSKRKNDRHATAGELVHDLEAAAAGILPARRVRLPRAYLVVAAATAVGLLSLLIAITVRRHTVSSTPPGTAPSAELIQAVTGPSAAAVPLGPVFTVNTNAVRDQVDVAAAMNDVGQAVIAWTGIGPGADDEICAQLYRPDGARVNAEFATRGEKIFTHAKLHAPAVAMDPRGGFMVAVGVGGWNNGNGSGIYARRFNSEGEARSLSIIVASSTSEGITAPAVAGDGLGNFVIAWQSSGQDGSTPHVFARLYDTRGEPLTAEFAVGQATRRHQSRPAVAMDANSVLFAWESQLAPDGPAQVVCRRFNRAGTAIGNEWRAGSTSGETTPCPSVDVSPGIGFVVAWIEKDSAGGQRIMARRFNADGVAKGAADIVVADALPDEELQPRAALAPDGSWSVFWLGHSPGPALLCRRFASDDAPFAQSAEVLTVLPRTQCPAIVAASGTVLAAWSVPPGGVAPAAVVARRWRTSVLTPDSVGLIARNSGHSAVPAIVGLGPVRRYGPFPSDVTSRFTALAANTAGQHVLAWEAERDGDVGRRIEAQRFDAQGAELGPAFTVSSDRHPAWWRPTAAIDADGSFVIAYGGGRSPAGPGGMYVRRFGAKGAAPPEEEFELAPVSDGRQSYPSAVMCDGSYMINWHRDLPKRGEARVMGRGFHGPSRQWGQEFYVSESSDPGWTFPSACADRYCYFSVASAKTEFSGERVRVRRFDPDADPVGEEFFLTRSFSIKETVPSAASDGQGNVLIVWREARHPSEYRIKCRRVDHTGAVGEEMTLNRRALWYTSAASVAMNPAGQAVAVWVRQEMEGGRQTLVARRFDPTGVIDEDEQELETLATGTPSYPCVAMDARGVFVVSWQVDHGPPQGTSVCVRRYGSESIMPAKREPS